MTRLAFVSTSFSSPSRRVIHLYERKEENKSKEENVNTWEDVDGSGGVPKRIFCSTKLPLDGREFILWPT